MRYFLYDYITDLALNKNVEDKDMESVYFVHKDYLSTGLFKKMNVACFISQNINYVLDTDYDAKGMPIINELILKDNFTTNIDKLLK